MTSFFLVSEIIDYCPVGWFLASLNRSLAHGQTQIFGAEYETD